jgi:hypothetical protein
VFECEKQHLVQLFQLPPPADEEMPLAAVRSASDTATDEDDDDISSNDWADLGLIEQETLEACAAAKGRFIEFDDLVAEFRTKRSVAKFFALLLVLDKRGAIELRQAPEVFGMGIRVRAVRNLCS